MKLAKSVASDVKPLKRKEPRYTPLSKRQDRPDAIAWLLRNHPELGEQADLQAARHHQGHGAGGARPDPLEEPGDPPARPGAAGPVRSRSSSTMPCCARGSSRARVRAGPRPAASRPAPARSRRRRPCRSTRTISASEPRHRPSAAGRARASSAPTAGGGRPRSDPAIRRRSPAALVGSVPGLTITRTALAGSSSWVSGTTAARSGAGSPVLSNDDERRGLAVAVALQQLVRRAAPARPRARRRPPTAAAAARAAGG